VGASKIAGVQITVRAVTGLGTRPQEAGMLLSLLLARQSWHIAVVIAVIDSPSLLVKLLLLLIGFLQTGFGLLGTDAVDGDEMPHQFLVPRNIAVK